MIELSYHNVQNGIHKEISMNCLYSTQQETDRVFRNALDLWGKAENARPHLNERLIDYCYDSGKMISIRFSRFEAMASNSWRGFRGIFMLHPSINPQEILPRIYEEYRGMEAHNERYLEQWQA